MAAFEYTYYIQLEAEIFNPPDVLPLIPIVNKSCNIEGCVDNMLKKNNSKYDGFSRFKA